jgi:hypothetical protein
MLPTIWNAKRSPTLATCDERWRAVIEDSSYARSSKTKPGARGAAMREEAARCESGVGEGTASAVAALRSGISFFSDVGVSPLAATAGSTTWMGGCLSARGQPFAGCPRLTRFARTRMPLDVERGCHLMCVNQSRIGSPGRLYRSWRAACACGRELPKSRGLAPVVLEVSACSSRCRGCATGQAGQLALSVSTPEDPEGVWRAGFTVSHRRK